MKASEAKELTNKFIDKEADAELGALMDNIRKAAENGQTSFQTFFDHDVNIKRVADLGYEMSVLDRSYNMSDNNCTVYYTVDWS